jgi:putative nucleotidyltransferase with HDIG domain
MAIIYGQDTLYFSDVVSALSVALDLTEGQPMGHAIRSCILGMRIAQELKISAQSRSNLYYALLLKDSGCSANAPRLHHIMGCDDIQAKREIKLENWSEVSVSGLKYLVRNALPQAAWPRRIAAIGRLALNRRRINAEMIGARCERGAEIARKLGLGEPVAEAIRCLDEHWDGGGYPDGRKGEEIPLLARILAVSQAVEVFASARGRSEALKMVLQRQGSWFDPEIVRAIRSLEADEDLWQGLGASNARQRVLQMEPGIAIPASPERLDDLCSAFAQVIDAKSPYTFNHSVGVCAASIEIAEGMGLAPATLTMVRRAALLHDIGKLSVSNVILEKAGPLNDGEWAVMRMHPVYTRMILENISGFNKLAFVAAAHHERLDGTGYPERLTAQQMTVPARIVATADVFQALRESRPYREGLAPEAVFAIMRKEIPHRLDADCLAVLESKVLRLGSETASKAASVGA